jgi:single-stranded-DNA-specific exonuclease
VDNGIASVARTAAAKAAGCRVLITDHHLPPAELPAADAIVNPNRGDCAFPCKALAGVGVLFYVLLGLRARLRGAGWFANRDEPSLADYLDLVAVGTVADVVPLDYTNRILVAQGLRRIRAGRARPGVYALARAAGRDPARLTATDIGFGLAPRLNAAGRLEDMTLGVDCLLASEDDARAAALELEALNAERRERQASMQDQAFAAIEGLDPGDDLPPGLCLYARDWHEGIVGLVAGRLRERYHRPAVAFAAAGDGGLKGSARSIPGVHIRDVFENLATRHPDLIERFGGHAMAAGLSLPEDRFEAFRDAFADEVARWVTPEMLAGTVVTDGELAPDDFSLETAYTLREGGPWGADFPEPEFDGVFEVLDQRIVGERHLKLRLRPDGGERGLDAIAFNHDRRVSSSIRAAYRLDVNRYQGVDGVQLVVSHIG